MSIQGTVKRYSLVIDHIRRSSFPSFKEIHELLQNEGFQISSRTLQRDLEDIRDEFGIEIAWDSSKNGYFIDYENSVNADYILHFLELAVSAQIMIDTLKEGKDALKYISFDSYDNFRGLNNIQKLLFAVKNYKEVTFRHTSYQTGKISTHKVRPYLLKEFQGRWYLYAENPSLNDFRVYGIDRIDQLALTDVTFKPKKDASIIQRFEDMIGVTNAWDGKGKQQIVLSFDPEQGMYFKSLPWHHSYVVISDTEEEFIVSLNIIPNIELVQRILMHSDKVKVIKPMWLKDEIKLILEAALKNYS
jgi:predicted DNA-binding transcriptional regulator YafY